MFRKLAAASDSELAALMDEIKTLNQFLQGLLFLECTKEQVNTIFDLNKKLQIEYSVLYEVLSPDSNLSSRSLLANSSSFSTDSNQDNPATLPITKPQKSFKEARKEVMELENEVRDFYQSFLEKIDKKSHYDSSHTLYRYDSSFVLRKDKKSPEQSVEDKPSSQLTLPKVGKQ